jgi:hypothetical protein
MPVTVTRTGCRIRFTLVGRYAFGEVLEAVADATHATGAAQRTRGLLDVRGSEDLRQADEVRTLARRLAAPGVFAGVTVVVRKAVLYGLARMLAVFAEHEGLERSAFRTEDAALEWLAST